MRFGFVLLSCLALGDGDRLLRAGDVDGAVNAYRDALTEQPDDARLELRLARALLMSGQVAEALPHAENGRSARGGEAVYAEALLRNGRVDEAAGLAEGPLLGEVLLAQGELEGAALLVEDPELVEWIAARSGTLTVATTAPASWLLADPQARPAPDERDMWLAEARLRADGGDVENAARLTLRALSAGEDVDTLVLAASLLALLDEDALPLVSRAQELATTDDERSAVALLFADLAPNAEAEISALEEATRLSGPDGPLLYRLAMAYEGVGRRPESARAAVAAANLGYEPARSLVAERYRQAGRLQQAARYEKD